MLRATGARRQSWVLGTLPFTWPENKDNANYSWYHFMYQMIEKAKTDQQTLHKDPFPSQRVFSDCPQTGVSIFNICLMLCDRICLSLRSFLVWKSKGKTEVPGGEPGEGAALTTPWKSSFWWLEFPVAVEIQVIVKKVGTVLSLINFYFWSAFYSLHRKLMLSWIPWVTFICKWQQHNHITKRSSCKPPNFDSLSKERSRFNKLL